MGEYTGQLGVSAQNTEENFPEEAGEGLLQGAREPTRSLLGALFPGVEETQLRWEGNKKKKVGKKGCCQRGHVAGGLK